MIEVIVVKYGLPDYEAETIQQVMNVAKEPYHLTVYDNYPGDENLSVVWNRLISRSDADYICLLNNDTVVQEGWDTKLLEVLRRTDLIFRDDDAFLDRSLRHPERPPYYDFEKFKEVHEYLASRGFKHSIGIVSSYIKKHPELKEYILSAKNEYEFCSHSHEHRDYATLNPSEQEDDIKRSIEAIEDEFGVRAHVLYAPYNSVNDSLKKVCQKLKIELDQDYASPKQLLEGQKAKRVNFHYWDQLGVDLLKMLVNDMPKQVGAVGPISNHAGGHQGGFTKAVEKRIQDCNMLSGFCVMFPKFVWKEVGGFDERFHLYGEDSDFFKRVFKKYPLKTRYDVFIYHHGAKSSEIATARGKDMKAIHEKAANRFLSK